jgi:hypothetical protein
MKRFLITAAALVLLVTTADAAPKLPEIFRGQWCGESHRMERCTERDGVVIKADGFDHDEIGCRLLRLTPQKPSRREREYRATFQCTVAADTKSHRRYYWIGFYNDSLFMQKANATFTAVTNSD